MQPTNNNSLHQLIERWLNDQAENAETLELVNRLKEGVEDDELLLALHNTWEHLKDDGLYTEAQQTYLINNILSRYPSGESATEITAAINARQVHRVHFLRKWRWAAASVLVVLVAGAYFLLSDKNTQSASIAKGATEIQPGREGAILTLADGSQIVLDTIRNGVVALQNGTTARIIDGTLLYEGTGSEPVYNTMSTPKGRQFHITLPDGTKVWMNAASSIRYSTAFTGTERKVEVSGEAYFEVVGNAQQPFLVIVNNKAEVEVLGTSFNVNAYNDEDNMHTTLLAGAVRIRANRNNPSNEAAVVLKPGQQAKLLNGGIEKIAVVNDADLEKVMAWKNGLFNFQNANLQEVLRQLSRWYDIEIVYENGIPANVEMAGEISRGVSLNTLLKVLGELGLQYKIEGRKLIVLSASRK